MNILNNKLNKSLVSLNFSTEIYEDEAFSLEFASARNLVQMLMSHTNSLHFFVLTFVLARACA